MTIPAIAIEQSNVSAPWDTIATVLNWAIWVAFLTEAVLMLRAVDDPRQWIRDHPLEVAIVLLTPPFLPASLQAARVFRLLRLLRLLRLGSLMRRFLSTEEGVRDVAILAVITVLVGGAGFAAVEKGQHLSTWDGVWWAINTVTTVGYGARPHTDAGRIIAIVIMFVGIGFVAILTAAVAGRFLRTQHEERRELQGVEQQLDEIVRRLDLIERQNG